MKIQKTKGILHIGIQAQGFSTGQIFPMESIIQEVLQATSS